MAGELLSVTIRDATPIDPKSSIGPTGSGWVAECLLADIASTVGVVDASKLVLHVSDPGYLADGATTTVLRTIRGTAFVRRTMPDGNSRMISTDGTDLTILIALDDEVWIGTTIVGAAIESGFYPSATASSASTITNSSTITYQKPHCGWLNFNGDICREDSVYVELSAGHMRGMRGQQVACVEFFVTDGVTTSSSVFANSPHLSELQTLGNIAEVYSATLDMSGQTNGAFSTVPAKIYPHIGDSSAILDLGVDGVAWPTPVSQTPLRIFCDRTGTYGGAIAYIDGIGAGTPTVSTNAATAKANPFASQPAAHAAIIAWNNANRGHNDIGGSIVRYINDTTSPKTYDIVNSSTNAPGLGPSITEKDPEASGEVIRTNIAQRQTPSNIIYRNLTFLASPGHANYQLLGYSSSGSPATQIFLDSCVIDNQNNSSFTSWHSYKYIRNVSFVAGPANFFQLNPADPAMAQMVGCVSSSVTVGPLNEAAYTTIGCAMTGLIVSLPPTGWPSGRDGMFLCNNRVRQVDIRSTTLTTLSRGLYIGQCLVEVNIPASAVGMNVFADGDLTSIQNYVDVHNSAFGERCSRFYNDNTSTRIVPNGLVKRGRSMFSVYDNYNIKDDRFLGGGTGSVGGWEYEYGVGNIGNVSLFGSVNRIGGAPANNADDNYLGMAWNASSSPTVHNTSGGPTQAEVMGLFVNYTVQPRSVPAYGGDYRPAAYPSALTDRVPAGLGAFKYDLAGNLRKQDGTGAAGAYEYQYTDGVPVSHMGLNISIGIGI